MDNSIPRQCPLCEGTVFRGENAIKDYSVSGETFSLWDCASCGLRFTMPAPPTDRIGAYYQSEAYISHSDTREGSINKIYHIARDFMLGVKRRMVAAATPSRRVLDIGCGTGYFLHHLKGHGYDTTGVEADPKARALAIGRFGLEVHPPQVLERGDLQGPFDAVTLWHVLEHVHDPHLYLKRAGELLPAGAVLLIAVPNFTAFDARWYGGFWAGYDVPRHLWHFRPDTLVRLVSEHGFALHRRKSLPLDPFYVALLSEKYKGSGAPGMLRAMLVALWSSIKSLLNVNNSSSIVYIFKKINF
jgi:2-polyprenyl-3-methyl-5-hydroxy-6-metoxy-1,4-benzoquinol methylase